MLNSTRVQITVEGYRDDSALSGLEGSTLVQSHLQTQSFVPSKMVTRALGGSTVTVAPDTRARLKINCSTSLLHTSSSIISTLWHCLVSPVLNFRIPEVDR